MPVRIQSVLDKQRWRRFWLACHLYLGLSGGLVFTVAGLTGSVLVFYIELDEIVNPSLKISPEQAKQPLQSYEALYQAIKTSQPQRPGAWRLELPRHPQAMLMARYYRPDEKQHLQFAPLMVWVNPYTAEVVSCRFWGEYLMTWIYDLHYSLLLDKTGKTIMGIMGLVLVVSLVTGLYLWWPKTGKFKNALTFKAKASSTRFIYDLHKINGVYGFLVLLLLLISGVVLAMPEVFNPFINRVSPFYQPSANLSSPVPGAQRISLDQAVQAALYQFPKATLRWLETPKDAEASYRIMLYQDGEPSLRFPKTMVWVDQYSGKTLSVRNPREQSWGDAFINLLHPLHNGEVLGLPGRLIVFISGFMPAILMVTGFLRWRQKRNAKLSAGITKPKLAHSQLAAK